MMTRFEVGKPFLPALGLGEGVRFEIGASGATLIYGFSNPTSDEVRATKSGQAFEIRFVTIDGIIWILSKCGNLEWTDAPYNPRLSTGIPGPESITDGGGLGLTLMMLDSGDAVVKSVRLIGLGTEFSRQLLAEAYRCRQQAMTIAQSALSINKAMQAYTTSQLVQMAPPLARYRL